MRPLNGVKMRAVDSSLHIEPTRNLREPGCAAATEPMRSPAAALALPASTRSPSTFHCAGFAFCCGSAGAGQRARGSRESVRRRGKNVHSRVSIRGWADPGGSRLRHAERG